MSSANRHDQCRGPAADIVWPASGAARVAIEIAGLSKLLGSYSQSNLGYSR
jgi:hypothetical protein